MHPHIQILHEAPRFAVVAKPAGIMVHRNKFSRRDESGVALLQLVRDQLGRHVYPVHRLDGGTSGCLLFAFDSAMCAQLQAAMQAPTAVKTYLAHCRGDASWVQRHTVDRPIGDSDGVKREAVTHFECLASCDDSLPERSSLIRCTPQTGRWHQIRKHLNGLSHPILGDAKHGDSRVNRWWRAEHGFQHLGLHCHTLDLVLPYGEPLSVRCPVRPDLVAVWSGLPWWESAVAAVPSLADDACAARWSLLSERAAEEHVDSVRVAAAGRGLTVFHRREHVLMASAAMRAREAFVAAASQEAT